MGGFIAGIYVIRRESHIKAKAIKIKTMGQRHIEETSNLANNGISAMLSSHSRTPEGYQIFLQPDADGDLICQRILDDHLHDQVSPSGIIQTFLSPLTLSIILVELL